jgi:polyphosphate kinase
VLPKQIADRVLTSGGFPYTETMKRKAYRAELQPLQVELLKLQRWVATRPDSKVVGSSPEFFATA